ncbi:IucA/IucC family siderophore biosynthesis protein [Paenibacillus sp. YYML68]|uniref:IucA/IucC family protein n=1 Tax=Paenibacillus sp. YYML68 TaxID=2909250 RepID=UPI0024917E7E|nr:IucA/IucC family protein [Paenibacillus sp. YYML68]
MDNAKRIAARATLMSLLNSYVRETGQGQWVRQDEQGWRLELPLPSQGGRLLASAKLRSLTGRHVFKFPVAWEGDNGAAAAGDDSEEKLIDGLITKLVGELASVSGQATTDQAQELLDSIRQSQEYMERFVAYRANDAEELYGVEGDFLTAEQSLLFGHLLHPTPKSRTGIPDEQWALYAPECKGAFQLHYFRADASIGLEASEGLSMTATAWIREELQAAGDPLGTEPSDGAVLIPLHPLQAEEVLQKPAVQHLLQAGLLENLGPRGRAFAATSSLRTVYHQDSAWMAKSSVPVRITNSKRVNLHKELERGVEVSRLLQTELGASLKRFPGFSIVTDPAYVSVALEGEESSGFEVVLRSNPFRGAAGEQAAVIASLVQDPLPGEQSRLGRIIHELAQKEGRSTEQVSRDWFRLYLEHSLKPMVWLYLTWGIALEAHQQNSVVRLKNGYPEQYYYRDNQGYYFCTSMEGRLKQLLPDLGLKSQTFCDDAVADERFRYYLIFNHMFGLINGFAAAGLVSEETLLAELREALEQQLPLQREPSTFLPSLLHESKLPCKANLLTRLYDMDELVGSLENQSVYVLVDNPLVQEVAPLAAGHRS